MGRYKQVSDDALLEAAREVFVQQGFGASTREIARRVGISEAILYRRYKTKLDLFFAAMVPPPVELGAKRGDRRGRGVVADLEATALEIMAYFRQAMPVFLQLVTHPSFSLAEFAERDTRMPLHRLGDAVRGCLERHRSEGRITADAGRIQAATLTLVATLHSLALFERMHVHDGAFPDQVVKNVVKLIAAGLNSEKRQ
jgi:AcrR family transcriptional regulator